MEKTERKKRVKPKQEPSPASTKRGADGSTVFKGLDIKLNPNTARQAVILSEIIGKPLSKRRHGH